MYITYLMLDERVYRFGIVTSNACEQMINAIQELCRMPSIDMTKFYLCRRR